MGFILTFCCFFKFFVPAIHQRLLLFPAPALYLLFAVERKIDAVIFLIIGKLYGKPLFGMVGAFPSLMLGEPQFKVMGAAGIVAAVGAQEYVHPSFHGWSFLVVKIVIFGNVWWWGFGYVQPLGEPKPPASGISTRKNPHPCGWRSEFSQHAWLYQSQGTEIGTVGGRGLFRVMEIGPDLHLFSCIVIRQRNIIRQARPRRNRFKNPEGAEVFTVADYTHFIRSRGIALGGIVLPGKPDDVSGLRGGGDALEPGQVASGDQHFAVDQFRDIRRYLYCFADGIRYRQVHPGFRAAS